MQMNRMNVLVGLLPLLLAGQTYSATIVSNLNDPVGGEGSIYVTGPPQYYAQEVVVGSQGAALGSVVAALGNARGSFIPSAELVNNNSGQPGSTVLTTFAFPTLPASGFADLTFTPNSTVTLNANTAYWFVLLASTTATSGSSDRYQWEYTDTNDPSVPLYAFTHDGVSWTVESNGPFLIGVNSAGPTAPEPSTLTLLGASCLALGALRLRRCR